MEKWKRLEWSTLERRIINHRRYDPFIRKLNSWCSWRSVSMLQRYETKYDKLRIKRFQIDCSFTPWDGKTPRSACQTDKCRQLHCMGMDVWSPPLASSRSLPIPPDDRKARTWLVFCHTLFLLLIVDWVDRVEWHPLAQEPALPPSVVRRIDGKESW